VFALLTSFTTAPVILSVAAGLAVVTGIAVLTRARK
jgi:hypothetical protein